MVSDGQAGPSGEPRLRTLVVDDDADARLLICMALDHSARFEVVGEATNGAEAVAVCREQEPDLVLLDLNMPEVDGLTALPRIREVCMPTSVVVVMSGLHDAHVEQQVAEGGGAGFISKGAGYGGLVRDLLALIDTAASGGQARPSPSQREVRWHFPADPTSGSHARRQLRAVLDDWRLDALFDDAALLTTELVNNAVVHARSDVMVTAELRDDALRIAVTDTGEGTPYRPHADMTATHGRGIMLVEGVANAWGTAVNGETKTVWFDLVRS
jgi:DNA-binding NarL/FixJ family response regulator